MLSGGRASSSEFGPKRSIPPCLVGIGRVESEELGRRRDARKLLWHRGESALFHTDWVNYLNMRLPNFANNALFPFIVIPS